MAGTGSVRVFDNMANSLIRTTVAISRITNESPLYDQALQLRRESDQLHFELCSLIGIDNSTNEGRGEIIYLYRTAVFDLEGRIRALAQADRTARRLNREHYNLASQ